jgi:hypothetical protein
VTSETLEEAIARNEQPLAAAAATRVDCVCARKWSEPWPKCPACAERSDAAEAGLRAVMVVEEEEEVERATAAWETAAAAAAAIAIAERKKQEAGGGAGEGKGAGRERGGEGRG